MATKEWWAVAVTVILTSVACSIAPHESLGTDRAAASGTCSTNANCTNGKVCDPSTSTCIVCAASSADLCTPGTYCSGSSCVAGCDDKNDCAPAKPVCDISTHTCFECLADSDCGGGLRCAGRICVPGCSASSPCKNGATCCSGACVDTSDNVDDCGGCGTACAAHPHGIPGCVAGACTYACVAGFVDCNGNMADGCEVDTRNDPENCAYCGHACDASPNLVTTCQASTCQYACAQGYADCNHDRADGCEVQTATDLANCGACGAVCASLTNETNTCNSGLCNEQCVTGFADCNGDATDGCEANLSDLATCGSCSNACVVEANQVGTCNAGVCSVSCESGFADCDGDSADGCEASLYSTATCGSCSNACPAPPAGNNQVAVCEGNGTCAIRCQGGFVDCDGNPANGCETNVQTDANNCGSCNTKCVAANGTNVCRGGACHITCNTGAADCDGNPNDGCEVVPTYYQDDDGDGYGLTLGSGYPTGTTQCSPPWAKWSTTPGDCNDNDANIHPGQTAWFMAPANNFSQSECTPQHCQSKLSYDYDCDGVVEGSWGSDATDAWVEQLTGNTNGYASQTPAKGSCSSNGTSCVYGAGWETPSAVSCATSSTYISDCLGSGTNCNAVFAAGGSWGCH